MNKEYTILLVDDEEDILHLLQRTLHPMRNCEVIMTTDPRKALAIVLERRIDMIMSDHRMPAMEGVALLKQVREVSPDTIRVLLSGYPDITALIGAINEGEVFRFVSKPWDNENLLNIVRSSLKRRGIINFITNVINKLQQESRYSRSFKVETVHDAQNICIKMKINESVVSPEEVEQVIDMILWGAPSVSSDTFQLCVGGAVEKKDGKTSLTFDLGDASVRVVIELPEGFKRDV